MAKSSAKTSSASKSSSKGTSGKRQTGTAGQSGTKRTTAANKKEDKRTAARKKNFIRSESAAILVTALGCFLLLADLGLMGSLGGMLLGVQRGLFGMAYFLLAICIVLIALITVKEKGRYLYGFKVMAAAGILIDLAALFHLMFAADNGADAAEAAELYRLGTEGLKCGGVIGGCITNFLKSIVGFAGAYLVLIALLVLFAVIITEKSFVSAARAGADMTVQAVRTGAGRTVEAARAGKEHLEEAHRENVIRREAAREEKKLRALEGTFDLSGTSASADGMYSALGTASGSVLASGGTAAPANTGDKGGGIVLDGKDTSGSATMAQDALIYAGYGRDIIGDTQPGLDDLKNVRSPLFAQSYGSVGRNAADGMNYDTQIIRNDFTSGGKAQKQPVNIREIDYDSDEVPFEETEEDKYRSYAHILDSGTIGIDAAKDAGFAVGHGNGADNNSQAAAEAAYGTLAVQPEHLDVFKTADGAYASNLTGNNGTVSMAGMSQDAGYDYDTDQGGQMHLNSGFQDYPGLTDPETGIPHDYVSVPDNGAADGETVFANTSEDAGYTGNAGAIENTGNAGDTAYAAGTPDTADTVETAGAQAGTRNPAPALNASAQAKTPSETAASAKNAATTSTSATSAQAASAQAASSAAAGSSAAAAAAPVKPKPKPYIFPKANLLDRGSGMGGGNKELIRKNAMKLQKVLRDFGVGVTVTNVIQGPRVSRYEMTPDAGVKVSRITSLQGDIKLALAAREIRIEAPIPGKSAVGIEVPNEESRTVMFRDILESAEFRTAKSRLSWGIGLDIQGKPVIGDVAKMPHLLVSGTTGSGKSVGINTLIMSILYRATPEEVRMILIDPKVVELSVYNGIPHLLTDVVTNAEKALSALNWAVAEMNRRYKIFKDSGTRNITGYNEKAASVGANLPEDQRPEKLPYILIVIDELAELMMHAKKDVEGCIVSLAQLARAAGIHLVIATQRPSVDVITGLIKSNIPSRVAYKLPSAVDSRTIIDSGGAETLLGNGDMLYKPGDKSSPARVQGAFLSDDEVERVVEYVRKHNRPGNEPDVEIAMQEQLELNLQSGLPAAGQAAKDDRDEYYADAGRLIITSQKASIGALQRKFKIGFNRAARIMDQLNEAGVVSGGEGTKERQILMSAEEFEASLN